MRRRWVAVLMAVVVCLRAVEFYHHASLPHHPDAAPSLRRSRLAFFDRPEPGAAEDGDFECACSHKGLEEAHLIQLSKPWRYFSSSHWFHICEYYLPHHQSLMESNRITTNATVIVVAPNEHFVRELTPMSFFLLALAFTNGAPRYFEVVHPSAVHWLNDGGGSSTREGLRAAVIPGQAGNFVYDSRLPVQDRLKRSNGSNNGVASGVEREGCRFICARFVKGTLLPIIDIPSKPPTIPKRRKALTLSLFAQNSERGPSSVVIGLVQGSMRRRQQARGSVCIVSAANIRGSIQMGQMASSLGRTASRASHLEAGQRR